jgi:hypothetical protein
MCPRGEEERFEKRCTKHSPHRKSRDADEGGGQAEKGGVENDCRAESKEAKIELSRTAPAADQGC